MKYKFLVQPLLFILLSFSSASLIAATANMGVGANTNVDGSAAVNSSTRTNVNTNTGASVNSSTGMDSQMTVPGSSVSSGKLDAKHRSSSTMDDTTAISSDRSTH